MDAEQIKCLASRYGIALTFEDARGNTVETDIGIIRRLLISMGVLPPQGDLADQADLSPFTPALVLRSRNGEITIDLPPGVREPGLEWQLVLEDGTTRRGHPAPPSGTGTSSARLVLANVPYGYHQFILGASEAQTALIVTPGTCWLPDSFERNEPSYGLSLQLYLLRTERNWGIGDFTDLGQMVRLAAARGCDVLGLNPLHQMFTDNPEHASPYSPASRRFLNILYIDVTAVPEYRASRMTQELVMSSGFQERIEQARQSSQVDYALVATLKLEALRLLHAEFHKQANATRRADYDRFVATAGESLASASLFQALRDHFASVERAAVDWHHWPDAYRSPTAEGARAFAREHSDKVAFHNWLQWIADQQLSAARDAATAAGMKVGLYLDLAVGCDRSGSETWASPSDYMAAAEVGAPPDIFNPAGQNWGLPPLNPVSLAAQGYRPFIELLRANMRHGGGLRIDHAMGLQRLYCIPEGSPPSAGAYVSYPMADLVGILALESRRHRCLVVGEDLGTVPAGFRDRMEDARILSYRVLFFEADEDGEFIPAGSYPRLAVAVAGSHDLPTLPSWLEGSDIELKDRLGLYPSPDDAIAQRRARETQRDAVLRLLGLQGTAQQLNPDAFAAAVHRFLGSSAALLAMMQLDDLIGEHTPVNVPATSTEHANWRRKYALTLEQIERTDGWKLLDVLAAERRSATASIGERRSSGPSEPASVLEHKRR